VSETLELKLPSQIESVDEAATKTCEFATELGLGNELLFAIDLAVRESVANAIKHGNKFASDKEVDICLENSDKSFAITVSDHGSGFNVEEIPDPRDPENLLKTNGRGILFMRSFMDEVEWSNGSDGGLVVRMVKNH
jgi:serine/threonine-protein kinase RsbW